MNIVLWILAGLLAALFLAAGTAKLTQSKEKLGASPNMAWTEDFSPGMLKTIVGDARSPRPSAPSGPSAHLAR